MKRVVVTGLRAWLVQRLTAVYLLGFVAFALVHWALDPPRSYDAWRIWIAGPHIALATALFFAALLLHAWVGLRDVILDYVPPTAPRVVVLGLLAGVLLAIAAWIAAVLLRAILT